MGLLDRLRNRVVIARTQGLRPALKTPIALVPKSRRVPLDAVEEGQLRQQLEADPNDEGAFRRLADIVRRRAAEGHVHGDPQKAADDAVWALAEEMARKSRAWYALVELGRLSVHEDRDGSLRRLATASDRDPSGRALAEGLAVLREAGLNDEALALGVGHWRPREHDPEVGRHLVHAAVDAGRIAEARRYLQSFEQFPDPERVVDVRDELERAIADADQRRGRFTQR
jgi:hypothetical protein